MSILTVYKILRYKIFSTFWPGFLVLNFFFALRSKQPRAPQGILTRFGRFKIFRMNVGDREQNPVVGGGAHTSEKQ